MEECHKLLTDQVDDTILRYNVIKPLPLGGEPGHCKPFNRTCFFNKDLEYLRYGRKVGRPALSISKMKAAYYPDVGLEQLVPDQFWIEAECKYDIAAMYGISHWWFQRQRFYIDRFSSEGDRRKAWTSDVLLSRNGKRQDVSSGIWKALLVDGFEKATTGKYGDSDGYTFDDPILILEILSRRFLLRGIYLITGSSKDGDGDTSFQWSQFTTQCSHLMFPSDGGLDGIARGMIGDNERVISNGEMVWIDVIFDGALGALREEEVVIGEGVVVTSSSLEILTNNCLGGIMVSLIFLEGLDEEALVEVMVE
ncbi:hypothetical protein Tco_1491087 [Tanacetum coccineum]